MSLWVVFVGMIAHVHGDVKFAHYALELYLAGSKHIIQSFAQLLHDLEKLPTYFSIRHPTSKQLKNYSLE